MRESGRSGARLLVADDNKVNRLLLTRSLEQPFETTQKGTTGQSAHVVAGPLLSGYRPKSHAVHCEVVAIVQVSGEVQWLTGVQIGQVSAWPLSSR